MQVLQPATDFLLSNNLSYHSFFVVRIKIYLQFQYTSNTPMMIKVNSHYDIVSIMSFMSQDSEFFRKKMQFLPIYVSHSYQKGVSFVGMRHLFDCFSIKFLLFLWCFYKKWIRSIWIILCYICRLEVSPFCRRTAIFCL